MYNTPLEGLRGFISYYRIPHFDYNKVPIDLQVPVPSVGVMPAKAIADVSVDMNWYYAGLQYQHELFEVVAEYHAWDNDGERKIYDVNIIKL